MKRKTVTPNLPVLLPLIKKKCRSNVVFTKEIRGKDKSGWVTEWSRGSNYPSPEEAVRMCQLLNTTPEEILMHEGKTEAETAKYQEDIALVQKMIEEKREKDAEKSPAQVGEGLSPIVRELFDFIDSASDEEMADLIRYAQFLKSKR